MNSRQDYVDSCKKIIEQTLVPGKSLVQYVRKSNGQPRGVVVAFRDPNSNGVRLGWSLCNIKVDRFDKNIGLVKAIDRAMPLNSPIDRYAAQTATKTVEAMQERASRYFKR